MTPPPKMKKIISSAKQGWIRRHDLPSLFLTRAAALVLTKEVSCPGNRDKEVSLLVRWVLAVASPDSLCKEVSLLDNITSTMLRLQ